MLLQTDQKLEEYIVGLLAEKESATASWLHQQVMRVGRQCSLQAIYKELSKLQKVGVVVKVKNKFSLRLTWVMDLVSLTDQMYDTHLQNPPYESILPAEGEKRTWVFYDLLKMDDFWAHVTVALFRHSKMKILFEWIPHPWFYLVIHDKQIQFQKASRITGRKFHMIIGGQTYLDKLCIQYWPEDLYEYSFAESPFSGDNATYLDVIDDYVLTIKLTGKTAAAIDRLYESIRTAEDVELGRILEVLTSRTKVTLTLERNPKKASKLIRKFTDFFGVSVRDKA